MNKNLSEKTESYSNITSHISVSLKGLEILQEKTSYTENLNSSKILSKNESKASVYLSE